MNEHSLEEVQRRHRAARRRENPEEVRAAIAKLEAMGAVRPELRPVVDVALEVVRAAREEADAAGVRAELAEEALGQVRPHVDELAERAEALERNVARRSAIDAARDERSYQEKRAAEKAEADREAWTPTPAQVGQIARMAEQVEDLRTAQTAQAAGVAKAVQLITVLHKAVKNEDGKSPVQVFRESGHVWTVRDADDGVIAEVEKRSEAIQLVADLLDEELAEAEAAKSAEGDEDDRYRPRDEVAPETPWRKPKRKRAKKNAHLL